MDLRVTALYGTAYTNCRQLPVPFVPELTTTTTNIPPADARATIALKFAYNPMGRLLCYYLRENELACVCTCLMAPANVLYLGRAVGPNICEAVDDYRFLIILLDWEFLSQSLGARSEYWHGSMVPREGPVQAPRKL